MAELGALPRQRLNVTGEHRKCERFQEDEPLGIFRLASDSTTCLSTTTRVVPRSRIPASKRRAPPHWQRRWIGTGIGTTQMHGWRFLALDRPARGQRV
jgi:hypothetical protein